LNDARAERQRALVLGKVRLRSLPPQFWLWTAVLMAAFGVLYWKIAQGQVENAKSAVMAKQRAVMQSLGPRILPFRDTVERGAMELAADPWQGDLGAGSVDVDRVTRAPAVYLRMRQANAKTAKSIRRAAVSSLHDGFTSCFFVREKAEDPTQGPKCRTASDCAPGLLCNEWDVCTRPMQPYNMRLAYRSLRVLSSEWSDELREAGSELAVSAYERDLDKVTRHDVPIAVELLTRAKFLTIVIDEEPAGGVPKESGDAGAESAEERVQRMPHFARVGIWDLKSGAPVARLRAEASAQLVTLGGRRPRDPETLAAQQRQANNCAVALEVKKLLAGTTAARAPALP
jgi:hypothetical protein